MSAEHKPHQAPTDDGRVVTFSFTIPFNGGPADICERMIRDAITKRLLNSLSEVHPDIRARVYTERYVGR